MDAIDELVERIEQRFQAKHDGWHIVDWIKDCIRDELRAANITIPPSPPEPGSLWEHKETGERRFVSWVRAPRIGYYIVGNGAIDDLISWHAWSANADELVKGVG